MSAKILIIDDELKLLKLLGMILRQEGFEVFEASSARSGLNMLDVHDVDVILSDVRLPDGFGVDLVTQYKTKKPHSEVILMTAYGNIPDGVQAMKNGAYDYIVKGDDNEKIIPLVYKALEKVKENRKNIQEEKKQNISFENVIGSSQPIFMAKKLAEKVAQTDATVLLTGETGTGKEVFANAIHTASNRNKGNFVALNCSAFSKEILESELFGHKKGAFTGAVADKKGLVEEAHNGTLFLDEIGEMPLELQAKLLRVLESGEYIKMGDTKIQKSNFRLIAATNRDLKEEIQKGNFREDLYFRLNIFGIHLPPLRERKEDIPVLAQFFVDRFSKSMQLEKVNVAENYFEKLKYASWKGNIRELKNSVERSMILMENNQLNSDSLNLESSDNTNVLSMSTVEKQHIIKVLNYTKGNKAEAARFLDIGIATLYRKIEEFGLK
ncbi:sigma-54 dependent transcriptional regulator [Chryseobacterium taklimakanense]|uniref:sigma-54-dependent transcriptional regulator n=1 Tax=Chryseobacterium taklimakanense TaxID=536441 RepID=UPI001EF5765B|nr:sigma-54 dependent transcriptional regulator [Chryseobacterium taklimakanense]MCG7280140.1 sigma-54 dependent transcriptional regulator [Chryseobacterium taklimakanense]